MPILGSFDQKISKTPPNHTLKTWVRLVKVGREKIDQQCWQEATTLYLSAHNISNKLSIDDAKKANFLDLYLRTQMELIYVLRKSEYPIELKTLEDNVLLFLEQLQAKHVLAKPISQLIQPIRDVANAPIKYVNVWINRYLAITQLKYATIH